MAEEGVNSPEGEGGEGPDGEAGSGPEGQNKSLESQTTDELVEYIGELREENATYRKRAKAAEGKVGDLTKKTESLEERLQELEDQNKTAEEKEAERIEALEAEAQKVESLKPFKEFVDNRYEAETKFLDDLEDDEQKAAFTDLLESFPEDDTLGRLRALTALKAAQGRKKEVMDPGDEGNPGETGGGASEKSLADKLSWSSEGMREAEMAGMT